MSTNPWLSGASRLKPWQWWIALYLLPCAAQPFLLGFYLDDWSVLAPLSNEGPPLSLERLAAAFRADPTRPAEAPVRYLLSSLLGAEPFYWQLALLLLNVALAWSVGRLAGTWAGAAGPEEWRAAFGAAAAWLVLPWSVCARVWPRCMCS